MGRGNRIAVSEMTAGSMTIAGSSAAMDTQVLNRAGLEMAAGHRTTAEVSAVMDSRELYRNFILPDRVRVSISFHSISKET